VELLRAEPHDPSPGSEHADWIDTGTAIDRRPKGRADCLWDGAKLYVTSHVFTSGAGANGPGMLLYRYSYEPAKQRYTLDPGFPIEFASGTTECLTLAKDSQGTLWAAWMFDLRVWISHSLESDRHWSTPVVHPRSTTDVADDICAIVAFQGNKVGVMWSDEVTDSFYFTSHVDGQADTNWSSLQVALSGPMTANDQISMKARRTVAFSRWSRSATTRCACSSARRPECGATSGCLDRRRWTRGILLVDEAARQLHCFATRPILGGTIYEKTSSMDAISFPSGLGTVVIRRADDPTHNDPTSTKQSVSGESGLVVLASHDASKHYWIHADDLGGPVPHDPTAEFHASITEGYDPLTVQFLDGSTGVPTAWDWDFGDGDGSSEQHPLHVYDSPAPTRSRSRCPTARARTP
jgi:hypothetical protein